MFCLYFSAHCYPGIREAWETHAAWGLPRMTIPCRSACSGSVETKARGWEKGQVQALLVVYMKAGSGESPSSRNSPERCHCSSPSSKTLTHVSGSCSYAKLGYLMPGAMPRARGEEVTAGVSLPQPGRGKAATPPVFTWLPMLLNPGISQSLAAAHKKRKTRETQQA